MNLAEKIKIIGLALFFSFLLAPYTLASDVLFVDQSNVSITILRSGFTDNHDCQTITATQNNISKVGLYQMAIWGINQEIASTSASLCNVSAINDHTCIDSPVVSDNTIDLYNNTEDWAEFLFSDYPTTVSNIYMLCTASTNGGDLRLDVATPDNYAGGQFIDNSAYDYTFRVYYNDEYFTPPEYEDLIFPDKPADGETVFTNNNIVSFTGTDIHYNADTLVLDIYPVTGLPIESYVTFYQSIVDARPYQFDVPLIAGDYQYKLELKIGGVNGTVATTTFDRGLINFTFDALKIATSTEQFFAMPFNVSVENVCSGIATSTIMGGIECGFKRVAYWAFFPSQSSVSALANVYTNLQDSFPFNAFFDLTDAVNSAVATSTPDTAGTIDLPFINTVGDYVMLPVLASSSLPNFIGSSNATLFRNSITWLLWLCAGVLIFFTFKKL